MKRVIIIEDQKLLRELMVGILQGELRYEIAAQCEDGESGLEACREHQPDLVVLDLVLPKISGLGVLRQIKQRFPECGVIVVSGSLTPQSAREVTTCGANGLLTKDCAVDKLKTAFEQVGEGGVYYSPEVYRMLREAENGGSTGDPREMLSGREIEVLQLVGEGYASKEVADMLSISVRTVEAHRSNIMRKLNLRGATDMARMAVKLNLVTPQ